MWVATLHPVRRPLQVMVLRGATGSTMANDNPTPNKTSPQQAAPPDQKRKEKKPKRPTGPPDPILEKRIETGADESDDLTS